MKRTKVLLAAAAALAVVVTAGCGSSSSDAKDSTSSGGPGSSSAPAPETSQDTETGDTGSGETSTPPEESTPAETGGGDDESFVCAGESGDQVPSKLILALVPSSDSGHLVDTAKPLTDALSTALGIPVEGVVSQNYAGAVEAVGADQAQIGLFAPLPMIQACQKYGAKIVLQSVRNGSSTYHTQFYTNKPDKYCTISPAVPKASNDKFLNCNGTEDKTTGPVGLEALKNLTPGTKVGLLDPGSTSGFIFPELALINQGIDPESDIDVVNLTAHDQAVLAAYNGDIEVGVSFDEARDVVVGDVPDVGEKVVVFAYSDEIPNDGVVVSGKLTAEWQDKITQALKDFVKTDEGKKTLYDIYQIDDLADAVPASLGKVAEAVEKLGLNG